MLFPLKFLSEIIRLYVDSLCHYSVHWMNSLWIDNRFKQYERQFVQYLKDENLCGEDMVFWDENALQQMGIRNLQMTKHIVNQIEVLCHHNVIQQQKSDSYMKQRQMSESYNSLNPRLASNRSQTRSEHLLGFNLPQYSNVHPIADEDEDDDMYDQGPEAEVSRSMTPLGAGSPLSVTPPGPRPR